MEKKIGEPFRSLPTDEKQPVSQSDLDFLKEMFPSKKRKERKPEPTPLPESESESDSESDSSSDSGSDSSESESRVYQSAPLKHSNYSKDKDLLSEIKSTFIASLLFVLLNSQAVDTSIRGIGMDGFRLICIKLFLFAIIFFVLRYKFL